MSNGKIEQTAVRIVSSGKIEQTAVRIVSSGKIEQTAVRRVSSGMIEQTAVRRVSSGMIEQTAVRIVSSSKIEQTAVRIVSSSKIEQTAVSWPETFHATFIPNIQRQGEDRIGWRRSFGTTISTITTTYPHHYPHSSYRARGLRSKIGRKNLRKFSHTLIHAHSDLDQKFEKALIAACRALKLIGELFRIIILTLE